MESGELGRAFQDGEVIIRQGDEGASMYVIQEGRVEVVKEDGDGEIVLAVLGDGEFFGEMAIFEREVRMATVRAKGPVRVLTIDKKNFLRKIHDDPTLAFRMVQMMSQRIRRLSDEVARLRRAG